MSRARREAVAAVARRHGVSILEDDAYAPLLAEPLPPLAALATTWLEDGTADGVLLAIRAETRARQAIAASIFPSEMVRTYPSTKEAAISMLRREDILIERIHVDAA